jgi:hypothetical protein
VAVQTSEKDFGRLSIADLGLVARLHKEGRSQQAIASVVGCSQQSISYTLKRLAAHSDDILSVMKAKSEQALEQWEQATKVGAKRGDHRPAKEFIEAAYPELRPTQGVNGGGGGVTINIGMPGQPVQLPTITVSPVSTADFRPQLSPADATESGS